MEEAVAQFEVLSWNLSGVTEEIYEHTYMMAGLRT
jgi:hypothetical protein